ncbi:unnamed protein product [Gulo gulo]|uniref:Uncharacterized protein n=1 Tax=Gulo gulo TaxID=48420 RepID=A0A9X9PVG0_GULGU|nr:unnamed protein product [Gulo gulo]
MIVFILFSNHRLDGNTKFLKHATFSQFSVTLYKVVYKFSKRFQANYDP